MKLTAAERKIAAEVMRDAIERVWVDAVDSGEGKELGITQKKLDAAEKLLARLEKA